MSDCIEDAVRRVLSEHTPVDTSGGSETLHNIIFCGGHQWHFECEGWESWVDHVAPLIREAVREWVGAEMSDCEHREILSQDCYPPILWCQRCHKTSRDGRTWELEGYWLEQHQRRNYDPRNVERVVEILRENADVHHPLSIHLLQILGVEPYASWPVG